MRGPQRQEEALAVLELIRVERAETITAHFGGELEVAVAIAGAEGQLQRLDGLVIEAGAEGEITIIIVDR
jgi:hypothetical protein